MIRIGPIAEKLAYDLQAATGKEIEIIDAFSRSVASGSERLHRFLQQLHQSGKLTRVSDGLYQTGDADGYCALVRRIDLHDETVCYLALGGQQAELAALSHTAVWLVQRLIDAYAQKPELASLEDLRRAYFEEILFSDKTRQEIRIKAIAANMDPETSCYVAQLRLWYDMLDELDVEQLRACMQILTKALQSFCRQHTGLYMLEAPERRVLIAENLQLLRGCIKDAADAVQAHAGGQFRLYSGISVRSCGHYDLNLCAQRAEVICSRLADETRPLLCQDESRLELLLEQISPQTKQEFVRQVFGGCPEEDIDEWNRIVQVLTQNNGSINRSASELFMHKNTLQYRLMRIKERIGLDPRATQDALVLQIAFLARQSINNDRLRRLELDSEN